jgi:hypothetical protein
MVGSESCDRQTIDLRLMSMYHQIAIFVIADFGLMILLYCLKSIFLKDDAEVADLSVGDRL